MFFATDKPDIYVTYRTCPIVTNKGLYKKEYYSELGKLKGQTPWFSNIKELLDWEMAHRIDSSQLSHYEIKNPDYGNFPTLRDDEIWSIEIKEKENQWWIEFDHNRNFKIPTPKFSSREEALKVLRGY